MTQPEIARLSVDPHVTVITPTYNRARFLPETLSSVLTQDYPHLVQLVLDDGSTDESPEVLADFQARYPDRLECIKQENQGQVRTVNRGFEMARTELVCILSSDDTLLPGAICALVRAFVEDPDALGVYPDFRVVDEGGETTSELHLPEFSLVDMFRWHANFLGPGVVFKRALATTLGGWNPSFNLMPDFEFYLRAGLLGHFRHVPRTLASWRAHPGSLTVANPGRAFFEEGSRLIETFLARPDLPAEITGARLDAYRNLHHITAISMLPDFNRPTDRFTVHDRYGWAVDTNAIGRTVESELLAEREHSARLQQVGVDLRARIEQLEAELASRRRFPRVRKVGWRIFGGG